MKKMYVNLFGEDARKCAEIICGHSTCIAPYENCKRCNHRPAKGLNRFGDGDVCPLAEYNIPENQDPDFQEKSDSPFTAFKGKLYQITLNDLYAVCALCNHSYVEEKGYQFTIDLDECFVNHCIDCPIQMVRENIEEAEAEYEYNF